MKYDFDLFTIGGGSGGVRASRVSAGYGAKVAIAESDRFGGTCVNVGCIPKKLFSYAAHMREDFEVAASFGWTLEGSFNWATLRANKDKEVARLEAAYTAGVEKSGGEVIKDRAALTGPNAVRLLGSGREMTSRYILVATGGYAHVPDIPGAELGLISDDVFELDHLPPEFRRALEAAPVDAAAPGTVELAVLEASAVRRVLAEVGGNVSLAAKRLGVARSTLYRMMRRHDIT